MNAMENLVWNPVAGAVAKTLIDSLWEGGLAALGLALALSLLGTSRARYAAASFAMLALLAAPAVTLGIRWPEKPVRIAIASGPRLAVAAPPGAAMAEIPESPKLIDELTWLAPVWALGVVIFQMRGIAGWLAARRLARRGVCRAPKEWEARLNRLRSQLRVSKPVELLESSLAEVPVVMGYLRPIILMPVSVLAGMPAAQVEAILLHELAHIRRHDYLVNLLQVFAEGLLFYHPAVWWISQTMRTERENCCDDLVVSATGMALEYAKALTALESRRRAAETALAATDGDLTRRVRRLIGHSQRTSQAALPAVTAAILAFTGVMAFAALQVRAAGTVTNAQTSEQPAAPPVFLAQAQATPAPAPSRQTAQTGGPDKQLYDRAVADIARRNYSAARLTLNTLINTYPASEYLKKAKLAIAESWDKEGAKAQAEAEYRDFIRFYPNAPEADAARARLFPNAAFRKWVNEDVVYIISDEEKKAFNQLTTPEEGEKFIEQFWERRNPVPGSQENQFKQEIYRRIAYANEHFPGPGGLAGWKTDRGRIYIQYGPPDEIEAHPAGADYRRPDTQGGGTATAFAFQQWRYRLIDGVGQNIIMEFVDAKGNGEYRMTMDPVKMDPVKMDPAKIDPRQKEQSPGASR